MIDLGLDGARAIVVGAGFIPYRAGHGRGSALARRAELGGPGVHATAALAERARPGPGADRAGAELGPATGQREPRAALSLDLDDEERFYHGAGERAERLERFATREVDLHGWSVRPTPDLYGLAVEHGEYAVSLMFGQRLVEYIQGGPKQARA